MNSRIEKPSQPDDNMGQYGETKEDTHGVEMLKFTENDEIKALNIDVKIPDPQDRKLHS